MNWTKMLPIIAFLGIGLFFLPIFPTSVVFHITASAYDVDNVHDAVGLSRSDVDEIVELVSQHQLFGNDSRYPSRLSLKSYIFDYEQVGFQAVGLMPLGFSEACQSCTVAAFSGVTRDALDVASTMYFLAREEGAWRILQVRDGVTGAQVDES